MLLVTSIQMLKLLLAAGADCNAYDLSGRTVLHYLVEFVRYLCIIPCVLYIIHVFYSIGRRGHGQPSRDVYEYQRRKG